MNCLVNKIKERLCNFFNYRKRRLNKFIKACGAPQYAVDFWSNFDEDEILKYFYWLNDDCNDVRVQRTKIHILYAPYYWEKEKLWYLGRFECKNKTAICYDTIRETICLWDECGNNHYTTINLNTFLNQLSTRI